MEKSVLRYALDNLIQGTSLVSKHVLITFTWNILSQQRC